MPYEVREGFGRCAADEYAVVNLETGEVVACHAMREGAERQVAALYANEPEAAERAELTAKRINDLPDSAFAYIEPGGKKDDQGKTVPRSLRHFPIHDAAHVRNALARAPQSPFGDKAMPKIRAAARKFGIEMSDETSASRSDEFAEPHPYLRSYPLEDIRIRAGDGRTVEAYAAVFDTLTEVRDQDGHYNETMDRVAFNRAISDAAPAGRRSNWLVRVLYNHGRTIYGTPSERASMPIGTPLEIEADSRGLRTVTRYHKTPLADEVLELIREGSIDGYSFQGQFRRSTALDPSGRSLSRPPAGGFRPDREGRLVTVRRLESGLKEYGPTPFPVYADAAITGMRAEQAAFLLGTLDPGERARLAGMFQEGALLDAHQDSSTDSPPSDAPDEGPVADDSPADVAERSGRQSLLQRIAVAKTTRPGLASPAHSEIRRERIEAITRPERSGSE